MRYRLLIIIVLLTTTKVWANDWSVASFSIMDDDAPTVTYRDNRGIACAMIEVHCALDLVGIEGSMVMHTSRRDSVYQVFLPYQARQFSITHPEYSTLQFTIPERLQSGKTYRMKVTVTSDETNHDETASECLPEQDSTYFDEYKNSYPAIGFTLLASYGYSPAPQHSGGLTFTNCFGRFGYYIGFRTSFHTLPDAAVIQCDANGLVNGDMPFYTGKERRPFIIVNGGFIAQILPARIISNQTLNPRLAAYIGTGYGKRSVLWETHDGQWICYSPTSFSGFSGTLGVIASLRGFTLQLGVSTIAFRYAELEVGLGYSW